MLLAVHSLRQGGKEDNGGNSSQSGQDYFARQGYSTSGQMREMRRQNVSAVASRIASITAPPSPASVQCRDQKAAIHLFSHARYCLSCAANFPVGGSSPNEPVLAPTRAGSSLPLTSTLISCERYSVGRIKWANSSIYHLSCYTPPPIAIFPWSEAPSSFAAEAALHALREKAARLSMRHFLHRKRSRPRS
jgi:hypothetical protein